VDGCMGGWSLERIYAPINYQYAVHKLEPGIVA
jgi:hypothetical protein